MQNFKTKQFFAMNLIEPFFEVERIYLDESHTEHKNLLEDINNLNNEDVMDFHEKIKDKIRYLNKHNLDENIIVRIHLLVELIRRDIAKDRIIALKEGEPYGDPELIGLIPDNNGLIPISEVDKFFYCFKINNNSYTLCLPSIQFNSHYNLMDVLFDYFKDNDSMRIRIDPLVKNCVPVCEKAAYIDIKLDWEKLNELKESSFYKSHSDKNGEITELVWKPDGDVLSFTCEELPDQNDVECRGSKYFHAKYDKNKKKIIHCDGAIRIYDEESLLKRYEYTIKDDNARKVGERIKIFQIDDDISTDSFIALVTSFFRWNYDLQNYFNIPNMGGGVLNEILWLFRN
ncbi:hypothetical protein [Methanobrevibacter sp. DSM 116169]|uniref:hypothetical protein n=1 Tax=Methanobrevibacter sp. DSM 116169 TaxID=3242727 RepID=UPI0038FC3761